MECQNYSKSKVWRFWDSVEQNNLSLLLVGRRRDFLQRNAIGYWVIQNGTEKYLDIIWMDCCVKAKFHYAS